MVEQTIYPTYSHIVIASLVVCFASVILNFYFEYNESVDIAKVKQWLLENKLDAYAEVFKENGWYSIEKIAELSEVDISGMIKRSSAILPSDLATKSHILEIVRHVKSLNAKLRFQFWLSSANNFLGYLERVLDEYGVHSLEDLVKRLNELKADYRLRFAYNSLQSIEQYKDSIEDYPFKTISNMQPFYYFWILIVGVAKLILTGVLMFFGMLGVLLGILIIGTIGGFWPIPWRRLFPRLPSLPLPPRISLPVPSINPAPPVPRKHNPGWFSKIFGNYFDANKTKLFWNLPAKDSVVGNEAVLFLKFFRRNGSVHNATSLNLKIEVFVEQNMIESTVEYEKEENAISIHFTPIKSGDYKLSIIANGSLIGSGSFSRYFKPGKIDPVKSSVVVPSSMLVLEEHIPELLTFDERDKYGNLCVLEFEELHKYHFVICEMKSGTRITPLITFLNALDQGDTRNTAFLSISESGVFKAEIFYDDQILSDVVFLVLSGAEMAEVNKNCVGSNWNLWYEAHLGVTCEQTPMQNLSSFPSTSNICMDNTKKKVYCYITPKFLIIREYWFKIIPKKLFSFRINPTIKILMLNNENHAGMQSFAVQSSSGQSVILFCKKRNVLVATFLKSLLKNIGGSECFDDKKQYFYGEIVKLHSIKANMVTTIKVNRENIVDDTWHAVKGLSAGDWWRKFEIVFVGELGLDYGGLAREWIHKLNNEMFNSNTLFRRFDGDNLQALIHPNPFRSGKYKKLKYYELAGLIVGKCLIDCACGQSRQQYVKARFTRSFLSQILGLRISWKYFETDDKEYYSGKIKYIIENDPSCLDIYFTEDVYDDEKLFIKTVELKPNGSKILVDELNKYEYLQYLAQYRLVESVKDEVGAFLKGFHTLIPDGLLSIFDENEVELLICGMDLISLADLKANHIKDYTIMFKEVIGWFWTVISGFSQEELSRLLQFTTGCSQLPPSGFAGLKPKFRITACGAVNTLPTAHTCFNNLCLPYYTSLKELKSKLLFAITEGSEGFGLS